MALLSALLRRPQSLRSSPARARALLRLALLEDRTVPATFTWTGAVDTNWNTSGNWNDGAANTTVPSSPTDVLVFDSTAGANLTSNNDIAALTVSEIQITNPGYTITGTQPVTVTTAVTDTTATGSSAVSLDIAGAATLTKSGGSTLILSGTNTFTGATTVSGGELQLAGGAALGDATAVTVGAGAALTLVASETIGSLAGAGNLMLATFILTTGANNSSTAFSGVISDLGDLIKAGSGTFTLSGANTYAGTTAVSGGTLSVTGDGNLGTGAVILATGTTLAVTGATTIDNDIALAGAATVDTSVAVTASGILSGSAGLTKFGAGTLTLTNTNNEAAFSGTITAASGTLAVANDNALGSGALTFSGGSFTITGTTTVDNDIVLNAPTTPIDVGTGLTVTLSGVISETGGARAIDKSGAGTLVLTGTNTYTGNTNLNGGTVSVAGDSNLGAGTINFNQSTPTLVITGAGTIDNAILLGVPGTVDTPVAVTLSGVISGASTFTKSSTGTLTLSGANTYTGTTTVSAGTLSVAGDGNLGTGAVTLAAGSTLAVTGATTIDNDIALTGAATVDTSAAVTASGVISGTGGLTKAGTGTLTLTGTNTFTGATTVSGGTLSVSGGAALDDGSAVSVSGGAILALGANETVGSLAGAGNLTLSAFTLTAGGDNTSTTFSGVASGTGGLAKAGTGTLTLSGANTYTGATTVSSGTLTLAGNSAIADTAPVTVSAGATLALSADEGIGSLAGAGNVTLGVNFLTAGGDNTSTTFSGVISGTGALTKDGTGTLTLSGANTYTGTTTVSAGTLSVAADANLGVGTVTLAAGTTLAVTGATTIDNAVALSGAATVDTSAAVTLSGVISGANGLTKVGTGTLTLSGANTYTGTTTVSAGTLSVAGDGNLGTGAVTLAAGSTLAVTGATTIDNDIALTGAATVDTSAAVTASGVISGTGGLTKAGTGTLTLTGTNTFTGSTVVSAGTTLVTGSIATSSGVQVSNGATLGGTGTVPAVTALSGATLAPGTSPGVINTGALILPTGATFSPEINGATVGSGYDQAAVTGTVDVTGATLAVTLGFTPVAGTSFTLIANDGADAVTGTFNGLAEGATFTSGGVTFTISYVGGTGNDVVISTAPPTLSISNVTAAEGNTGGTPFTFTVTLSVPSSQTVTVNYATAPGTATDDFVSISGTLTFAPGETSKTVTVTVIGDTVIEPDETFTVVLSNPINATIATGTGTGTITNDDRTSPAVVSIGTPGTPGTVRPIDPTTGAPGTPITAFAGFGGEIRVAAGDVNGDGLADTVTGAGAGAAGGHVKVFAADGTLLYSFLAFTGFSGGVFVSTGDVNGDGFEDIVVAADAGAAPHVKVFSGKDGALLQSFLAYDAGFRGGVRVSTGDVNGDGFDDIITGSGPGSTPHVKVLSGNDGVLLRSFLAYDAGFRGGVYVASGDVNGDGRDDIVTGTGPGTRAHVKVFSASDGSLLQSFFAYDAGFRGGVRVGTTVVNGQTAVLTGAGPGAGPHVKVFVNGLEVSSLFAGSASFTGGVYVG
ncbi:Extracellular serine protease precursor [Gemmata obscuriglobus]|uniref:Transporter n=1 Tax=Gemmata obscuriglobus TaxID=114 RepID=A0A2Z3H0Z6_9BACT|nr:autotransporter-associated beta strand repeat-containing protein [Gemmata obscuriglobus]AWM37417.1 transporter [Gemmata obscuriglobus]QEG29823.1 Extracellular serine protease precursor [Gemmata obscuriglobus]VTS09140.1 na-ca exchanger integrin-beta4 : Uncharacterized protein OS=Azospirillum lipoferum (strain 4B) GN=AZOLI_p60065 PE=4 SV=1: Autotrns_rpt: Autotrns_rpt: Autotrns_rpt: Autotrns_rpt: Autotrns_rpt: Autotrns_rpt: Autotrns_rpt: Autotrns_rpt: Autotrns_rpt: Autotrns_rpt: Calx-beta: VCBS 